MNIIRSVLLSISITSFLTTAHAVNAQPLPKEEQKDLTISAFYYPRDQAVFEYVEKRYQRPDGTKYLYGNYFQYEKSKPSRAAVEYSKGFHAGLGYFANWMPMDSSGFATKKFHKEVSQRSKAYQLGFDVAYYVFSLIRFEVDQAAANHPPQGPESIQPKAADAPRVVPKDAIQGDKHILPAPAQKALIETIGKKHLRPDGKYFPHGNHTPQYQFSAEINEAFNEGMRFFLSSLPQDNSGSATNKFFKNCRKRDKSHQIGVAVAYEIYSLHTFEVEQAAAVKHSQTPNSAQP